MHPASFRVTFGLLEAENKTSSCDVTIGVRSFGGCYSEWTCVYFVYVQINNVVHFSEFVLLLTNLVLIHLIIQMTTPPLMSPVLSLHLILFFPVARFPFHYLLIWKTKSVIDEDEENVVLSTRPISSLQGAGTLHHNPLWLIVSYWTKL